MVQICGKAGISPSAIARIDVSTTGIVDDASQELVRSDRWNDLSKTGPYPSPFPLPMFLRQLGIPAASIVNDGVAAALGAYALYRDDDGAGGVASAPRFPLPALVVVLGTYAAVSTVTIEGGVLTVFDGPSPAGNVVTKDGPVHTVHALSKAHLAALELGTAHERIGCGLAATLGSSYWDHFHWQPATVLVAGRLTVPVGASKAIKAAFEAAYALPDVYIPEKVRAKGLPRPKLIVHKTDSVLMQMEGARFAASQRAASALRVVKMSR